MCKDGGFNIAIIGMAGKFPNADSISEFWENIKNGEESIAYFNEDELREAGVSKELMKDPDYVKAHGIMKDIEKFDAGFFNMTAQEAELTDPQHRFFLECTWEALEDAGYIPDKYDGVIGVFGGASQNTYLLNNISKMDNFDIMGNYQVRLGNEKDFLSTRISYKFNLTGPSLTVQTACSTSLVAVHLACQSILNGECDIAIAGGVTIQTPQKSGYMYRDGGILSPDGHCRAFDEDAKGTVLGNGVGILILKSLDTAIRDKDNIYAVIKGTAINNDGSMKVGFTAPSVEGQSRAIQEALSMADLEPDAISYIETHGTGTQLGDPIEIAALKNVFPKNVEGEQLCPIGSTKPNIGHIDVASGIAGAIKVTMMLKQKLIPPSINFRKPNSKLGIENSRFFVNTKLIDWNVDQKTRYAGISSFGLGGTNAHIVVGEYINNENNKVSDGNKKKWHILPISAKTNTSLKNAKKKYINFFKENPHINIEDAAYTLAVGRKNFENRFYCLCQNASDFVNAASGNFEKITAQRDREKKKTIFIFCFPELSADDLLNLYDLYENEELFHKYLNECFTSLAHVANVDLLDSKDQINLKTIVDDKNKEVLQFAFQYALFSLIKNLGIDGEIFVGDEIGNYVVACLDHTISLETALLEIIGKKQTEKGISPKYLLGERKEDIQSIKQPNERYVYIVFGKMEAKSLPDISDEAYALLKSQHLDNDSASKYLLSTIGEMWVNGLPVSWDRLYESNRHRISLPTYCFDKKKYWIEPIKPQQSATVLSIKSKNVVKNEEKKMISKEAVLNRLKSLLRKITGFEEIVQTDNLYDLCEDSFGLLQLNNNIEKEFDLKMPLKNIIENDTVEKLAGRMYFLLNNRQKKELFFDDPIVTFNSEGEKTPIFFIHPAGGTVMGYNSLIRYLPKDYPVYGLQYTYKEEKDFVRPIDDIASDYIKFISDIQPSGPVILGGHSFGGNAAFEMAIKLQQIGRKVEHLIMFDSHPPVAYYSNQIFDELMFLKAFPRVCAMYFDKKVEFDNVEINKLEDVIDYLKKNKWIPWGFDNEQFKDYYKIWRSNHNSLRTHMPKEKYDGDLIFFRAKTMQPKEILEELNINLKQGMDIQEWAKLSNSDIRLFEIPGSHYTILNEPNVKTIGSILNDILK